MAETIKDPAAGLAVVAKEVEAVDAPTEAKTLASAMSFWSSSDTPAHGLGWQTQARWQRTIDVSLKLGLIEKPLAPEQVFTNAFFDAADGAK
jgi:hypothetical protein